MSELHAALGVLALRLDTIMEHRARVADTYTANSHPCRI